MLMNREKNLKVILIDYVQLMSVSESKKHETRQQEVTNISKALKRIAKEFNISVIALSQLSRANESRISKRPQLNDLRESGAVEQGADVVIMLHRTDFHERSEAEEADLVDIEIILAKQRNGPVGSSRLEFAGKLMKFLNPQNNPYEKPVSNPKPTGKSAAAGMVDDYDDLDI
jgi:replicative DNA helicase